jgi:hypothetical protein
MLTWQMHIKRNDAAPPIPPIPLTVSPAQARVRRDFAARGGAGDTDLALSFLFHRWVGSILRGNTHTLARTSKLANSYLQPLPSPRGRAGRALPPVVFTVVLEVLVILGVQR